MRLKKRPVQKHLFHIVMLSMIVILIGGGAAFLYQQQQGSMSGHADSDSVVGPPSLPASYVDAIFQRLGSPMTGTGAAVEAAAQAANIDDAFALAVWWTETNDGAAGVGKADLNPGSVRGSTGYPSAYDGYTIYPSYTAAVNYWFSMMKKVYIDRGLTTVYAISHPYVGTSTSDLWAGKVVALMQKYQGEAPPTPTPTPTISPDQVRNARAIAQQEALNPQEPVSTRTPDNKQSAAPVTPVVHVATTGLSENARQSLILLSLALALVLGLWALDMNRRSARRAKLVGALDGNLQEKLRAGMQQPAALFQSFTSSLGSTGNLAVNAPNTEELVATNPLMPAYNPGMLFPVDAAMSARHGYFSVPQTPQVAQIATGQLPAFNATQPGRTQFAPRPSFNLPAHAPAWSGQSAHGLPRRVQLQQQRTTEDLRPIAETTTSIWDQIQSLASGLPAVPEETNNPWKQPQPVGTGASPTFNAGTHSWNQSWGNNAGPSPAHLETANTWRQPQPVGASASPAFNTATHSWNQGWPANPGASTVSQTSYFQNEPQLVGAGASPASSAASNAWNQPQPAGVGMGSGRSNGLLSRYREMQAQERRE
jgi:hypothetical protein